MKQVGAELGVRYVLEGSVRKAGNRIALGELIDTASARILGGSSSMAQLEDVFALQDRVPYGA